MLGIVYLQKHFLRTHEEWNHSSKSITVLCVQTEVTNAVLWFAIEIQTHDENEL